MGLSMAAARPRRRRSLRRCEMRRIERPSAGLPLGWAVPLCAVFVGLGLVTPPATAELEDGCSPGMALVRFEPGVVDFPAEIDYGGNAFVASVEDAEFSNPQLRESLNLLGVTTFKTLAPGWRHMEPEDFYDRHGRVVDLVDFTDAYLVRFEAALETDDVIATLRELPGIVHAECDPPAQVFFTPNDSLYPQQWHLNNTGADTCEADYDVNAPEAWDVWQEAGTKIGICDMGIDKDHEDLQDFIDTGLSRSFVTGMTWWQWPGTLHGTFVAVVAAAGTNNDSVGVAGLANLPVNHEDDLIVSLRIFGTETSTEPETTVVRRAIAALDTVCSKGVYPDIMVVNCSWGYRHYRGCGSYSTFLRDAFRNAFEKGINLVCAAGNDSIAQPCLEDPCTSPDRCVPYPAAYEDYSLATGAIQCHGGRPDRYFIGSYIDLTAPGSDIYTTCPSGYASPNGTSLAAPQVSAAIALLLGRDATLTNEDCYQLLQATARDLSGSPEEWGRGLLRVDTALAAVTYPGAVVRGSVQTSTAVLDTSRWQHFRNVGPLGLKPEEWGRFWVKVYRLQKTVSLWNPDYAEIKAVWTRGRSSTGLKNLARYDSLLHAGYTEVAGWDSTRSKATLRTYAYKVYEDSTESNFLAWVPEDPAGGFDMAYSVLVRFLVDSLEARAVPPGEGVAAFGPAHLPSAGRATLRLRLNRPGTFTVTIYDVLGRRVRDLVREEWFDRGEHRLAWDGCDRQGMPVAAGVYLARLQQEEGAGSRPRSARLLLIR
ncbi:MAG: S8 family serine peptidase [Candidatus Eisenbacteria bacterium]|nr:S8 family serine peptidase [Candidatus Eisenbacteria bacterium]